MTDPSAPFETPLARKKRHAEALEKARAHAKAGRWVECASLAAGAVRQAFASRDYPGCEEAARVAKDAWKKALDAAGKARSATEAPSLDDLGVRVSETGVASCAGLKGGFYLLSAPGCVGIDGRTLKDLCLQAGKAALVLVREPETRDGRWPVVAVGPVTIRARVHPPKGKGIATDWCLEALGALEAAALESVVADDARERVEELVARLDALPECAGLYDALIEACAGAEKERELAASAPRAPRKKAAPDASDEER